MRKMMLEGDVRMPVGVTTQPLHDLNLLVQSRQVPEAFKSCLLVDDLQDLAPTQHVCGVRIEVVDRAKGASSNRARRQHVREPATRIGPNNMVDGLFVSARMFS